MNIEKHDKKEIATRQLETALLLYFAGKDLFSVITLAGAAEEVFGQLLQLRAGTREEGFRSLLKIMRPAAGAARGEWASVHETEQYVHMDARREAEFLIGRAIDDFHALTGELTDPMRKFNEQVRSSRG